MADNSLKALTSVIQTMAEKTQMEIKKDVHAIKEAICGPDGISKYLIPISDNLDLIAKKSKISNTPGGADIKNIQLNRRKLLKNTDSIASTLSKILKRVEKIQGSKGGSSDIKLDLKKRDRGDTKIDSISKSISIIQQLKGIKLKDFIFAKTKMKHISKLMERFRGMFKQFKNQKEMEATVSFANSAIDLVKKLSKIVIFALPAKIGLKLIERLFLGGKKRGGLLAIFHEVDKNKRQIRQGKIGISEILAATGAMFLTTILLVGVAVLSIPAMLGALAMRGIVWIMSGTFKLLNKAKKNALVGSLVLLIMSASVITFAVGLGFMVKAVKNMDWKDFGMIMANITALAVILGIMGIPPLTEAIGFGAIALALMGASLIVFGIGISRTAEVVRGIKWDEFGNMLAKIGAVGLTFAGLGVLSIPIGIGTGVVLLMGGALKKFAKALDKWKSLGNIKSALENIKKAVTGVKEVVHGNFDMKAVRQLRNVGKSLLKLYKGVKNWDKFDGIKAAANIDVTIKKLQEVFKTQIDKDAVKSYRSVGRIVRRLYRGLRHWETFNGKQAAKNVDDAITKLKETFNKDFATKGVLKSIRTLVSVTNMSTDIIGALKRWEKYTPVAALDNIDLSVNRLLEIFGMKEDKVGEAQIANAVNKDSGLWGAIKSGIKKVGKSVVGVVQQVADTAKSSIKNQGIKRTMSTLQDIMVSLNGVRETMIPWEDKNTVKGVKNITRTVKSINSLDITKAATMIEIFKSFSQIGNRPIDRFSKAVHEFSDSCNNLIDAMNNFEPIGDGVTIGENGETKVSSGSINIQNTNDLAQAIATAIRSLPVNVETNISDVRLVVNNEAGRRVVLTLDN